MPDKQDEMIKLLRNIDGNTGYIGYISTDDLGENLGGKLDKIADRLGSIDNVLRDILDVLSREE